MTTPAVTTTPRGAGMHDRPLTDAGALPGHDDVTLAYRRRDRGFIDELRMHLTRPDDSDPVRTIVDAWRAAPAAPTALGELTLIKTGRLEVSGHNKKATPGVQAIAAHVGGYADDVPTTRQLRDAIRALSDAWLPLVMSAAHQLLSEEVIDGLTVEPDTRETTTRYAFPASPMTCFLVPDGDPSDPATRWTSEVAPLLMRLRSARERR